MAKALEKIKKIITILIAIVVVTVMGYVPKENLPKEVRNMDRQNKSYLVTSIESEAFFTEDAEEAIVVYHDRINEYGASLKYYEPGRGWITLAEAKDGKRP